MITLAPLIFQNPKTREHLFLTVTIFVCVTCFCLPKQNVSHPFLAAIFLINCVFKNVNWKFRIALLFFLYFFLAQLRSSFNKAFNKKGSKPTGPYADIEEIATPESSAPSSPKVYNILDKPFPSIKTSTSPSSSG